MPIKRTHYFDHQFLVEADFTDEQKYHLEMRRRLNQVLHTFGIAEGLEVVKKTKKIVTVRPGVAIDRLGREMILEAAQDVDLSVIVTADPAFITIAYDEQQTDPSTATAVSGNTRFTEHPILEAVTTPPPTDGSVIRLACIDLTAGGNVPDNPNDAFDGGVRQTVAPRGERGLASIGGVSNPGGDVDLAAGNGITITTDKENRRIAIAASGTLKETLYVHGDIVFTGQLLFTIRTRRYSVPLVSVPVSVPLVSVPERPPVVGDYYQKLDYQNFHNINGQLRAEPSVKSTIGMIPLNFPPHAGLIRLSKISVHTSTFDGDLASPRAEVKLYRNIFGTVGNVLVDSFSLTKLGTDGKDLEEVANSDEFAYVLVIICDPLEKALCIDGISFDYGIASLL